MCPSTERTRVALGLSADRSGDLWVSHRSRPKPGCCWCDELCRVSCSSDVDLPGDAELVGERTKDVSPEHLFEWAVLGAARTEFVVGLAELCFVGSDQCQ